MGAGIHAVRHLVRKFRIKRLVSIIIAIAILLVLAYLTYLGQKSGSGRAAGLVDGKLSACPDKPNCVCSEYPDDISHAIEPIAIGDISGADALKKLKNIIQAQGGKISTARENYFAATFSSALFGFIDDLEIRIDIENGVIHLRSASRVGTSDLGANSRRVDMIKKLYREM